MTDASPPTSALDAHPIPPRYWWLKHILLACMLLVLALVGLRWWWGYEADRRLQAKIAHYRALGQPVTPEDFQSPAIPDEENAAHYYTKAANAIINSPELPFTVDEVYSELDDQGVWRKFETKILALYDANAEALDWVDQASGLFASNWEYKNASDQLQAITVIGPAQRKLAKLQAFATHVLHHKGDDAEAIQMIHHALHHSVSFAQMRAFLIGHLITVATDAMAINQLESITPELVIAKAGHVQPGTVPASRESVERLIVSLSEEDFLHDNFKQSFYGERAFFLDSLGKEETDDDLLWGIGITIPSGLNWVAMPMFKCDGLIQLDAYTMYAELSSVTSYPDACRKAPKYPFLESGIQRAAHCLSRATMPASDRVHILFFKDIALRRLAATTLALRLYEFDHGQRPAELTTLVPDYLPAVPLDPFTEGDPIRYLPDAKYPRLYSVGEDGVDHGGDYGLEPAEEAKTMELSLSPNAPPLKLQFRQPLDRVFFLTEDYPRQPSELLDRQVNRLQAVENDGDGVSNSTQTDQHQQPDED